MKLFVREFKSLCAHDARTLPADCVGKNASGWFVKAVIQEDYYKWVNHFKAFHPDFGFVYGDFDEKVVASSLEAYQHFTNSHPFEEWDYWDI